VYLVDVVYFDVFICGGVGWGDVVVLDYGGIILGGDGW